MTGNTPSSLKGNKCENVMEYVEDDIDELLDSDFSKADAIVFDAIDIGKAAVLPLSKLVYSIETLGESFRNIDLADHLQKVDPNESGSLDRFYCVKCYVDKEVSLDS